ncbi:LytR/AlgR family response regulator transcription factor [Dyadobacter luticola]|uniref:Response regulator transcription factor n=1 Tax=Dyadobacter luticola TaxID=1979387 RepID=A0A5R9L2P9_9BACT|nr:LytTR family DNA-binding domain-containing protein [Dyadobacter luticola]TLV02575.1 response regulator transcription factor [Dyadobacter luticola]
MIKALIIDDEQRARNVLAHYLISFVTTEMIIREAGSVHEALATMEDFTPDVVFLDVEMPYQNGFDFLATQTNPPFDIIFITAYNHYAIQAIRFSALDYLLKPVDIEELKIAVDKHMQRAISRMPPADQQQQLLQQQLYENLTRNIAKKDIREFRLAVPSSAGVYFFGLDEILRLEADKNYTAIHLVGKRPFLSSKTLKHFDDMLSEFNFLRTHKSHLINPRHIKHISHNNQVILLTDGTEIEVSRRKKDLLNQYVNPHKPG